MKNTFTSESVLLAKLSLHTLICNAVITNDFMRLSILTSFVSRWVSLLFWVQHASRPLYTAFFRHFRLVLAALVTFFNKLLSSAILVRAIGCRLGLGCAAYRDAGSVASNQGEFCIPQGQYSLIFGRVWESTGVGGVALCVF